MKSQIDILRRTVDRGLKLAVEEKHTHFTDVFQHLLDELERLEKYYVEPRTENKTYRR
jgi:hypothetical protein